MLAKVTYVSCCHSSVNALDDYFIHAFNSENSQQYHQNTETLRPDYTSYAC